MRLLGIDPSINHTGWGIVDTSNQQPELVASGVVMCDASQGDDRYGMIAVAMADVLREWCPDLAVVEWPTFEDSARGKDLVKKKGLTKLCAVAGVCVGAVALRGVGYELVTAWEWKGKYPKPNIRRRVEELLGNRKWTREDEWEALGLALWAWKQKGHGNEH